MRWRGLLSEISILFVVLPCDVSKNGQIGRQGEAVGHSQVGVWWYVQVEAGNTAEGAIAAAGALIVPSPQSCLRHRCGGVHQTSCITLACDNKHDYNNTLLFSDMHSTRQIRAHAASCVPLR